jgi:hypothetical protein
VFFGFFGFFLSASILYLLKPLSTPRSDQTHLYALTTHCRSTRLPATHQSPSSPTHIYPPPTTHHPLKRYPHPLTPTRLPPRIILSIAAHFLACKSQNCQGARRSSGLGSRVDESQAHARVAGAHGRQEKRPQIRLKGPQKGEHLSHTMHAHMNRGSLQVLFSSLLLQSACGI